MSVSLTDYCYKMKQQIIIFVLKTVIYYENTTERIIITCKTKKNPLIVKSYLPRLVCTFVLNMLQRTPNQRIRK